MFARKLIRLFGGVTREDIDNEARAISKLCGPGTSRTIVEVLKHGWLPRDSSCYFIDMELCFESLEQRILSLNELPRKRRTFSKFSSKAQNMKFMEEFRLVLGIAYDIAEGLSYLHALHAVHRDLKPRNGTLNVRVD